MSLQLEESKPSLCIYHGNCADGFGAAWVVKEWAKEHEETMDFHPGVYQRPPPDVSGRDVIIVDFSYKKDVMFELCKKAKSVIVLDHHKTAIEDLASIAHLFKDSVFDIDRSGAMITWQYFFPSQAAPMLLEHIQDRDLWRFKYVDTRGVQANLFSYPYDFEVWDGLMYMRPSDLRQFAKEGEAIERKHFKDICELMNICCRQVNIQGYDVVAYNLPYTMSSDAGHLAITEKEQLFGCCYWHSGDDLIFSLRSQDTGIDVSQLAKFFGGGGHRNAAGFTLRGPARAGFLVNGVC